MIGFVLFDKYKNYLFVLVELIWLICKELAARFRHASHYLYEILESSFSGTQKLIDKSQWQQMMSILTMVNVLLSHHLIV